MKTIKSLLKKAARAYLRGCVEVYGNYYVK